MIKTDAQLNTHCLPLISCIMPTANRRTFVTQAIKLFQAQDYPNKELIIVEDGTISLPVGLDPNMRYSFYFDSLSIGQKRNEACQRAFGEIIALWDDDDYFGPQRLSRQVEPILSGEADITACKMDFLLDLNKGCLYRCSDEVHDALFKHGVRSNTLMFRASYWRDGLHYEDSSAGEDTRYLLKLIRHGARLKRIVDPTAFISVRHGMNVSASLEYGKGWEQVSIDDYIPHEHQEFYRVRHSRSDVLAVVVEEQG